jgi:glycerate-2-kinase
MAQDCESIYKAAIRSVDPSIAIHNKLELKGALLQVGDRSYNLESYDEALVLAFGKASSAMASAVVEILRSTIDISGLVIVKDGHATQEERHLLESERIFIREASHPVPDFRSVKASNELLSIARQATERTLVLACISGGGSALFCSPHPRLSLGDLQATNTALLQSGWSIQDMNVVRKRLDIGKGGRLAAAAYPADIVSLILSDVLGDPLDLIASGPTVHDTSTLDDAWNLVQRLPADTLPSSVMELLWDGVEGEVEEPVPPEVFDKCYNLLVGNNELAVTAAAKKAEALGYHPVVLGTQIVGEAKEVGKVYVALAQHLRQSSGPYELCRLPAALIAGGETTVSIPAGCCGKGGRNQEMALGVALGFQSNDLRQVMFCSVGTDGSDGPTDAAGAIVDGGTIDRLRGDALKAMEEHDAYPYLYQVDSDGHSPLVMVSPVLWALTANSRV